MPKKTILLFKTVHQISAESGLSVNKINKIADEGYLIIAKESGLKQATKMICYNSFNKYWASKIIYEPI